jgi:ATP-dependent DNA helicase RecQ
LGQGRVNALPYHAGMEADVRSRHQDTFLQEDGIVVVATVAFGMGIDKPDARFVLHADMPANIESYYEEIGRAGRDGLPADTLILYGMGEIRLRRLQIDDSKSSNEQKRVDWARLNALVALCESPRCRRQTLLIILAKRLSRAAIAISAAAAPRQSTARSRRRKCSPPWCAPANASAPNN